MPDWWLDERAHAGTEHLDAGYVAGYERKAGYDPGPDVEALERHGLNRGSTVVDLGCGTGVFALAVAPRCRRVVAVDISPPMAAVVRAKVHESGTGNVDVVEAGFLSYEHTGNPADFVFTRNALHHLPDFWKGVALARIASLVRRGGILRLHDLVFDFDPADATEHVEAWMGGAAADPTAGFTATELAEHTRGEFSTYSWLLEPMLERAGFEIIERETRSGAYAAYTCRR